MADNSIEKSGDYSRNKNSKSSNDTRFISKRLESDSGIMNTRFLSPTWGMKQRT